MSYCTASCTATAESAALVVPSDESPFFDNDMNTMRSSSSSSEGLPRVIGLSREGSLESNEVNTHKTPQQYFAVTYCIPTYRFN